MSTPTPPGPPTGDGNFLPPLSGGTPGYQPPTMPDITDLVEGSKGRKDKPEGGRGLGRNIIIGGVIGAIVIAGGAFFAGKASAAGPATLADALQQAQAGTLPCGTSSSAGGGFITRLCGSGAGGAAGGGATGQAGGAGGGFGGGFGGRGVAGTVTAVSATSITVNTRAGSVTVAVPSDVAVAKTVSGSMTDVTVGSDVTVASTTDASGNRTASRITIVPAGTLPGGGGGGAAAAAPQPSSS